MSSRRRRRRPPGLRATSHEPDKPPWLGRSCKSASWQLARERSPPPSLRLPQAKLSRNSNQIARGRIRRFESYMPSHPVVSGSPLGPQPGPETGTGPIEMPGVKAARRRRVRLVVMGHEDIVWEEDLTIRVLCWSWGILSLSDRSRLLNLWRFHGAGPRSRGPGFTLPA